MMSGLAAVVACSRLVTGASRCCTRHARRNAPRLRGPAAAASFSQLVTNVPQPTDTCVATFVWIDGTGTQLSSRSQKLAFVPSRLEQLPQIACTESFACLADRDGVGRTSSDVLARPVAIFDDPTRPNVVSRLIMCDTYLSDGTPSPTNHRHSCALTMEMIKEADPWFGIEQEYTFVDTAHHKPIGWSQMQEGKEQRLLLSPPPPSPPLVESDHHHHHHNSHNHHYCGVGCGKVIARAIVDLHHFACLHAGISITGTNAEAMLSQWEFQLLAKGVAASDELWMSRFLLQRIAEDHGIVATFKPKPVEGQWTPAACHVNFSVKSMREEGGIRAIKDAIDKLARRHEAHMRFYYGSDENYALSGTSSATDTPVAPPSASTSAAAVAPPQFANFSWGIADRNCCVRIPRTCAVAGYGYLEDRRPSSNVDPYVVTNLLARTCVLNETD